MLSLKSWTICGVRFGVALGCLCVLLALPRTFAAPLPADLSEGECPVEQTGEAAAEEFVVCPAARRRWSPHTICEPHWRAASLSDGPTAPFSRETPPAIIGHRITNDLRAPLLV